MMGLAIFETLIMVLILLIFALTFINSVETLGEKLRLTEFATGAILVAFLTAVPEALLAILSPLIGTAEAQEIGIGAVVSAPSITLFLGVPLVLLVSRAKSLTGLHPIKKNYLYFALILPLPIGFGLVNILADFGVLRQIFGLLLLALFIYLGRKIFKEKGEEMEAREELYLAKILNKEGSLTLSTIQTFVGIFGMIIAANLLIQDLSKTTNPFIFTLIIAPFATCLEETITAVIWSIKGRSYLGLSVLSGENVIQVTAVFAMGILFTNWSLSTVILPIAFLMALTALVYYLTLSKILLPISFGLVSYLLYLYYLFLNV